MVLVKMLMEINPLLMRGSMVMTMVMIFPSRRDVSPAEQLRQSPRLVSPGSTSWRRCFSRKLSYDISSHERLHIAEDGHRRANRGPMRQGHAEGGRACPPPSWPGCGAPSGTFFTQYFLLSPKMTSMKFQGFWS